MAAVTSGLAGGSVSAAKVDVVKTIDTSPSATITCLHLMLWSPFLRLDYFTPSISPGLRGLVQSVSERSIREDATSGRTVGEPLTSASPATDRGRTASGARLKVLPSAGNPHNSREPGGAHHSGSASAMRDKWSEPYH